MNATATIALLPTSAESDVQTLVCRILDDVRSMLTRPTCPGATFRLQFNGEFTFRDARDLVPYLAALGITHVYASPYLKARAGSTHGYDIVDHAHIDPRLGSEEDYDDFVRELHAHGMSQILDVVPNHMGVATNDNAWWMDVLENGPSSPYASFFDIDWMPLKADLANKVLLPVLGDQFGKVLEAQQLALTFGDGAFSVHYYDRQFPIAPRSSAMILRHRIEELEQRLGEDNPQFIEYQSILTAIGHLPAQTETDPERINERRREQEVTKRRLRELCQASLETANFLVENVRLFNGQPGDPRSFDLLDQLLLDQSYRLAYWRVASDEINYRRFFDINELAAICMENPSVFEKTHELILRLVEDNKVAGLRIDHPDGLFDPAGYFARLQQTRFLQLCHQAYENLQDTNRTDSSRVSAVERELAASSATEPGWCDLEPQLVEWWLAERRQHPDSPFSRPLFLVVEKILGRGERLPEDWLVHGTTGYEFLNTLNGVFVERSAAKAFDGIYSRFMHESLDFKNLVYECKQRHMDVSMSSEISVLGHQLDRISEQDRSSRDFTLNGLTAAIREIIACFPVYRAYVGEAGVHDHDRQYIEMAVARAKQKNPATSTSIFDFVRDILLLRYLDNADEPTRAAQRRFVGRFQQVTGPVMAKGLEDTTFYIYNRLVSLNEVGGEPDKFGVPLAAFHQQNLERQAHWPHALLTTSTHDTKRSEDVRARINVLSELPREWRSHLARWSRLNRRKKTMVDGEPAPHRNAEYLLYQTLIGTWPFRRDSSFDSKQYVERLQQYLLKAAREAKVRTSWVSPNETYEQSLHNFVSRILDDSPRNAFLLDFEPFANRVAQFGIWNSLSQTLLKLASPGIPDIYQGTELLSFTLVDPDNRRPVDYALRREILDDLRSGVDRLSRLSIMTSEAAPSAKALLQVDGLTLTQQDGDIGKVSNGEPQSNGILPTKWRLDKIAEDAMHIARASLADLARELVEHRHDGRIKMFVNLQTLEHRHQRPMLYTTGSYIPLEATGSRKDHVCAFARKSDDGAVVIVAPRLTTRLVQEPDQIPVGQSVWQETCISLPKGWDAVCFRNLFTGEMLDQEDHIPGVGLKLASVLRTFPVALLEQVS